MLVTSLEGNQTLFFSVDFMFPWIIKHSPQKTHNLMIPYRSTNQPNKSSVGGFNPSEKYWSNWIISSGRGEHKKYLKPPLT